MAFCGTCGTKLNGQAFCPNCGTPVGNEVMVSGNTSVIYGQPKSERQMALDELDAVIDHFSYVEDEFNELIEKTNQIENLKQKKILRWVFSMPIFVLVVALLGGTVLTKLPDFVALVLLVVAIVLPIALPIYLKIQNAKEIKALDKYTDTLTEKVMDNYNSFNGECPVGFNFYNPVSLSWLRELITSGRASTVSQAMNLMMDDIHKNKLEQQLAQTLNAAEVAAYYAKDASHHSRAAARSASRAADAAEGSYWNTL